MTEHAKSEESINDQEINEWCRTSGRLCPSCDSNRTIIRNFSIAGRDKFIIKCFDCHEQFTGEDDELRRDVNVAELVARFEQAVIDHSNLYQVCHTLCGHGMKGGPVVYTAMEDAGRKRNQYRLELLQLTGTK